MLVSTRIPVTQRKRQTYFESDRRSVSATCCLSTLVALRKWKATKLLSTIRPTSLNCMKTLFKLHGVIVPVCIYFGRYDVARVLTVMVIIKPPYYVGRPGQAGLKLWQA